MESYVDASQAANYSLKKRISLEDLIESFVTEVSGLQKSYIDSVKTAFRRLSVNFTKCKEMDDVLGSYEDSNFDTCDVDNVETLKDGTRKLKCIIGSCQTSTYKLSRHINDLHKNLSNNQKEFAVQMARTISRNKTAVLPRSKICLKPKRNILNKTSLVSRKYNYKKCILCEGLYLNLSDHIFKSHGISRDSDEYSHYVRAPKVIPKVFTKLNGTKRVEMLGEELEEAVKEHGTQLKEQRETLKLLKSSRDEIEKIRRDMKVAETREKYDQLKEELCTAQELYISLRYRDGRKYNAIMTSWYNCYLDYLTHKGCKGPKRIIRMAFDVLICFQKKMNTQVSFVNLMDARFVRDVVRHFRITYSISYASKAKYVCEFQKFLLFLILDVDSPERKDSTQIASRHYAFEEIKNVFSNEMEILNKMKGKEMIVTKGRAKKKLMSEEELEKLMTDTVQYIETVSDDIAKKTHLDYTENEILKVRNSLIAVATVRIGRRSKEMTRMTLLEVEEAEITMIGEEKFHIINVAEQKNSRGGKPAPVPYTDIEYSVLKSFITDMRPKLTNSKFCDVVFPASSKVNSHVDQELGLSAAFKILQKFETFKGKKISSRSVRGSKVTISRQKNLPNETLDHIAKAMSHQRSTADGFYDFNSLDISVRETLLSQTSRNTCSTPIKDLAPPSMDYEKIYSTDTEIEEDSVNETVMDLRSKKVRKCKFSDCEIAELKLKVGVGIDTLRNKDELKLLRNSKGTICISPIVKLVPEARGIPIKILRSIISEFIKEL